MLASAAPRLNPRPTGQGAPIESPVRPRPLSPHPTRRAHPRRTPYEAPRPIPPRLRLKLAMKRLIDIVGSIVGLLLGLPILLMLAPAVRAQSRAGALFAHSRLGLGGRPFRCLKLRTMRAGADATLRRDRGMYEEYCRNGFKLPSERDGRLTPLGRFLRATSLDEVPQFWNVLRGEMSLVGPRPIVREELAHYGDEADELLSVKPGMTGAWAVRGRSLIAYPTRAAIELEYVRSWTLRGDLAILLRTLVVVLERRGAY
jgi:exopolysaccharide production protein ExoY